MTGEEFLRLLVRAQIRVWESADEALRDAHQLPLARYLPMRVIDQTPDCRIQDIADQLAITTSGASQAVDRVEKAGHAVRRPNPADRRSSVVELSDAGRQVLASAAESLNRHLDEQFSVLPEDARRQMEAGLTLLLTEQHG